VSLLGRAHLCPFSAVILGAPFPVFMLKPFFFPTCPIASHRSYNPRTCMLTEISRCQTVGSRRDSVRTQLFVATPPSPLLRLRLRPTPPHKGFFFFADVSSLHPIPFVPPRPVSPASCGGSAESPAEATFPGLFRACGSVSRIFFSFATRVFSFDTLISLP